MWIIEDFGLGVTDNAVRGEYISKCRRRSRPVWTGFTAMSIDHSIPLCLENLSTVEPAHENIVGLVPEI